MQAQKDCTAGPMTPFTWSRVSTIHQSRSLHFEVMHGRSQGQLAIGRYLVSIILQQAGDVCVGDAVMVAAKANVVLLKLDGPKRGVQLPILVLAVHVHSTHKAHQEDHENDDDRQDDDVELRPRDIGQGGSAVVRRAGGRRCRYGRRAWGAVDSSRRGWPHGWTNGCHWRGHPSLVWLESGFFLSAIPAFRNPDETFLTLFAK